MKFISDYLNIWILKSSLVILLLITSVVFAESNGQTKRVYYSNVENEIAYLPNEIFGMVNSADFEFFSIDSLPVKFKSESAFSSSKKNSNVTFELPDFTKINKGQVFDFVNTLNQEQSFLNKNLILYKINAKDLNLGLVKSIKRIRVFSKRKPLVNMRVSLSTLYPSYFNQEDETVQLYRSKLTFLEPKTYKGYKFLHYNFLSSDEDAFWMYSPITKNKRALSETVLYDYFFNVDLRFKDLFNFYLKPSKMEVLYVKNKELYGAFKIPYVAKINTNEDVCKILENYKSVWNVDTKKFPGAKEYLLSNVYFTKRKVLEVGAVIKDVFSSVKKRIFYIDQELGIVLFESAYDDEDNLISYKLPVHMFFRHNSKFKAFEAHNLVVDKKKSSYSLSDTEYLSVCSDSNASTNKNNSTEIDSLSISGF